MKPICFMVMPFGTKPTVSTKEDVPATVDFDRLWEEAYRPAIEDLGYMARRADSDPGSVIVKDMLNRLRHADLVLADLTLPNGNVYYEVGVRHAARDTGCCLVAADWADLLFDAKQMRRVTFPLARGQITAAEAKAIRTRLVEGLGPMLTARTPYAELTDAEGRDAMADAAAEMSAFQTAIGAVRYVDKAQRGARIEKLLKEDGEAAKRVFDVAHELVYLIRDYYAGEDNRNWALVLEFIGTLPPEMRQQPVIREQEALATAKAGDPATALAALEDHYGRHGWTAEACGIAGGRAKTLFRAEEGKRKATGDGERNPLESSWLDRAIAFYDKGMLLDLNEYYCASNLPGLLRDRGGPGDEVRAATIEHGIVLACDRARARGDGSPWLIHTLFGTAFRGGMLDQVAEYVRKIKAGVGWQLGTTLDDAESWIEQAPADKRAELARYLEQLRKAAGPAGKGSG